MSLDVEVARQRLMIAGRAVQNILVAIGIEQRPWTDLQLEERLAVVARVKDLLAGPQPKIPASTDGDAVALTPDFVAYAVAAEVLRAQVEQARLDEQRVRIHAAVPTIQ